MAVSYFTGIDLHKNQLENARIHVCAGSSYYPQSPSEGQIIYDSSDHLIKVYKGSTLGWEAAGMLYTEGSSIYFNGSEINVDVGSAGEGDVLSVDANGEICASVLDINGHTLTGAGFDILASEIPMSSESGASSVADAIGDVVSSLGTHTGDTSNPHGVTAAQLGDGTLGSGVKATTPAQSSNDTSIATTAYVTQKFGSVDALTYKGAIAGGSTGAYGALTSAANKGDVYKVSAAGKIDGVAVEAGDMIICNSDDTAAATSSNYSTIAANWDFIQGNIDGVVTYAETSGIPAGGVIPVFNDATGKVITASGTSLTSIQLRSTAVTHPSGEGVGSATKGVYVDSDGAATEMTYSLNADVPATASFSTYVKSGSVTKSGTGNVLTGFTASGNGITFTTDTVATSGSAVTHSVPSSGSYAGTGSATKGVYVDSNGVVQEMTYSVGKSVPADAVFTDHITTASSSGTGNVVTGVTADASGALTVTKGTVQDTATAVTHTESTAAGSGTQPVYVNANGVATPTTYALNKTVPADAVFTDHITTAADSGTGNVVTGVSADANGALTVTKKAIPVVRTATGSISSTGTSAEVSYSGTYLSSYVKDSSNNIVVTAMNVAASKVTFTCAAAPGSTLTCVVVYMDPSTAYSL